MADGKGCKCAAYDQSECACDADWTPQELIDARAEIERLRLAIRRLADQDATLSMVGGNVIVEMDATLTDAEREAIEWFAEDFPGRGRGDRRHAETLRGFLGRLGIGDNHE